jgi:hypothetical protein
MGFSVHMSAPVWALITHRDGGYNVSSAVSTHTVGHGRKELRGRVTSMREEILAFPPRPDYSFDTS